MKRIHPSYVRRSDLYSTPSLRPMILTPVPRPFSSPATRAISSAATRALQVPPTPRPPPPTTFVRTVSSSNSNTRTVSSGGSSGTNTSTNSTSSSTSTTNNGTTTNMAQKLEALEETIKKIVDENAALKVTVEELKSEVAELKDLQNQSTQRAEELESIIKNRRNKVHTTAIFRSTPEMTAANVQVRFSSEIATFFLKDFVNFDMENKALEEVGKLIAIKMFEQLIPEGCTLATFSISSTPRYGYITIPSNLFEELADKLVVLTQGHEDNDLKHAILMRINFGLNDKIQRTRKQMRNGHISEAAADASRHESF